MALNCLGAHNTRQRPGPPEQEPEVKCSRVTGAEEESWIVIQIQHFKLNIGAELGLTGQGARCSVHSLFLLAIWTLLMPGSDVSVLIFTLRYGSVGTIVQLC